jgi:hypothetical protein
MLLQYSTVQYSTIIPSHSIPLHDLNSRPFQGPALVICTTPSHDVTLCCITYITIHYVTFMSWPSIAAHLFMCTTPAPCVTIQRYSTLHCITVMYSTVHHLHCITSPHTASDFLDLSSLIYVFLEISVGTTDHRTSCVLISYRHCLYHCPSQSFGGATRTVNWHSPLKWQYRRPLVVFIHHSWPPLPV